MKNLKKLLPLILSLSFVASPNLSLNAFAANYCDSYRNAKGGYIDYSCANPELAKVWDNHVDFSTVKHLGSDGDDEYYCFNFRALNDVFEERKLEPTGNLWKEHDVLSKFCYPLFFNLNRALKIGITSLLGAVGGYFLSKIHKSKTTTKSSETPSPKENSDGPAKCNTANKETHKKVTTKRKIFSTLIGALNSGLAALIGLYVNYNAKKNNADIERKKKQRELLDKIVAIENLNERNSNMLNLLLCSLERPELMLYADMFCFYDTFNSRGTPFDWDTKYAGIDYSKEELASFPAKFKEIAAKIRKNLKENNLLDLDIAPEPEKQPELPPLTD